MERHLRAAEGYLELGMPQQAHEELEEINSDHQTDAPVLALRVYVHQQLGHWTRMESAAAVLCQVRPDDPQWLISLAYATRRARDLMAAREILWQARERFPGEPMIRYNLACYECQLGRLPEAREHLDAACQHAEAFHKMALADADLLPLHDELRRA